MDRRKKAALHINEAARLKTAWKVEAVQARYRDTGDWYAMLEDFPAALFDKEGYILFSSKQDLEACPYLNLKKHISPKTSEFPEH